MRITEVDQEVTQQQLDALEKVLDRVFKPLGIDVEFTRHFLDRVNDERNYRQITITELAMLFKKEFQRWGKPIARLGPDAEAVMKDLSSDINIPFALDWNKDSGMLELVAKTVMRKKNFRTSNKEFPVEAQLNENPLIAAAARLLAKQGVKVARSVISKAAEMMPTGVGPDAVAQTVLKGVAVGNAVGSKLKENEMVSESGSAPGVGAIHHSEIAPTLQKLEKQLGIPLLSNALGSVGKKEFSGDIDIAVQLDKEDQDEFQKKLEQTQGLTFIRKTSVFITSADIVGYDPNKTADDIERTGKVQIDFMPGDVEWMKNYYHSPHSKSMSQDGKYSKYKGIHRNILIASIAGAKDPIASDEKTPDGRPMKLQRFIWSPTDGLVRVERTPVPKKNGDGYTKKNSDRMIEGPWKSPDEIAEILGLGSGDALYSFETLYDAVKKNFPSATQLKIFKDFVNNRSIQAVGIPEELKDLAS